MSQTSSRRPAQSRTHGPTVPHSPRISPPTAFLLATAGARPPAFPAVPPVPPSAHRLDSLPGERCGRHRARGERRRRRRRPGAGGVSQHPRGLAAPVPPVHRVGDGRRPERRRRRRQRRHRRRRRRRWRHMDAPYQGDRLAAVDVAAQRPRRRQGAWAPRTMAHSVPAAHGSCARALRWHRPPGGGGGARPAARRGRRRHHPDLRARRRAPPPPPPRRRASRGGAFASCLRVGRARGGAPT